MDLKRISYEAFYNPTSRLFTIVNDFIAMLIIVSCFLIALESIPEFYEKYHLHFILFEAFVILVFSVEYALRVIGAPRKKEYVFSFMGIIDLLTIISGILILLGNLFYSILYSLRLLRAIRIIRLIKIVRIIGGTKENLKLTERDIYNIQILILVIAMSSYILGSILYFAEHSYGNINSIPEGILAVLNVILDLSVPLVYTSIGYSVLVASKIVGYVVLGMIIIVMMSVTSRVLLGEDVS